MKWALFSCTAANWCPTQDGHLGFKFHNANQICLSLAQSKGSVRVGSLTRLGFLVQTQKILPLLSQLHPELTPLEEADSPFYLACWALIGFCLLPPLLAAGGPILVGSTSSRSWVTSLGSSWRSEFAAFFSRRTSSLDRWNPGGGASISRQQMPGTPHQSVILNLWTPSVGQSDSYKDIHISVAYSLPIWE